MCGSGYGNAPTKRGGSDGKGKGSDNRVKRHTRPIADAARGMGRGGGYTIYIVTKGYTIYIVTKVLIGVSPYVSRSSKVGECCRWRLSSMSIDIFDILFSASFARRTLLRSQSRQAILQLPG